MQSTLTKLKLELAACERKVSKKNSKTQTPVKTPQPKIPVKIPLPKTVSNSGYKCPANGAYLTKSLTFNLCLFIII